MVDGVCQNFALLGQQRSLPGRALKPLVKRRTKDPVGSAERVGQKQGGRGTSVLRLVREVDVRGE